MSASERKAFQQATVEHALKRLTHPKGSRRFLVADEVGLGKTLIAQGVIEGLQKRAAGEGRTLRVFYLCSSLSIASQNMDRLLDMVPEEQREAARVRVDRLTMIPGQKEQEGAPFYLYALTPGTSIQGGTGKLVERVLIGKALKDICPDLRAHEWFHEALRGQASYKSWHGAWGEDAWPARADGYLRSFRAQLARALERSARTPSDTLQEIVKQRLKDEDQRRGMIELLRRAMTLAVVEELAPDLVIFDEFQRFFEILPTEAEEPTDDEDHNDEAQHVVRTMLRHGTDHDPAGRPAVLLLSATPYRMYARLREGGRHHEELFDLLRFLYGDEADARLPSLKEKFRLYRDRIVRDPPGSDQVHEIKQQIERDLKLVMARTERRALVRTERSRNAAKSAEAAVEARDLKVFKHLASCVRAQDRSAAEPYWSSIPYPLQMMRQDYVASTHADLARTPPLAPDLRLARAGLRDYSHSEHPHPKLRALLDEMPRGVLALPWLPPSRSWWPLGGRFREVAADGEPPSKALIFSRFRAVPRALATVLSYEAERVAFRVEGGRRFGYWTDRVAPGKAGKKRAGGRRARGSLLRRPAPAFTFGASKGHDFQLLLLFLPFPRLAVLGDPLALDHTGTSAFDLATARERIRARLVAALGVDEARRRREPSWRWALQLERKGASWDALCAGVRRSAQALRGAHGGVAEACERLFDGADGKLDGAPSPAELEDLAEHALTAPGVVLFRAVQRVFGEVEDEADRIERVANVALVALRTYLDEPEWHMILAPSAVKTRPKRGARQRPRAAKGSYPRALRQAVWEGNLEAVLDEYLVSLHGLGRAEPDPQGEASALKELSGVLGIRGINLEVDGLGQKKTQLGLRCHAALPFGMTASETTAEGGQPLRSDTVRKAFNSPFRPMALVTTSIGQEGLDFHRYCRHIVHWDLPGNPVDLEQREGRIARYGGLSVRQALAAGIVKLQRDRSPWHALAERWRTRESAGGMVPWWDVEGARIRRTIVRPSFSEQEHHHAELENALALYRYALGQPDQEALVRALERRIAATDPSAQARLREWLQEAALDLCPLPAERR